MAGEILLQNREGKRRATAALVGTQQVPGDPPGGIAQHDVFEQSNESAHPKRHPFHELEAKLVVRFQQLSKAIGRQQRTDRVFERLGVCRAVEPPNGGNLGEGHPGLDEMEDMVLAGGSELVDPDDPAPNAVEPRAAVALTEDEGALLEADQPRSRAQQLQRALRQLTEKTTVSQYLEHPPVHLLRTFFERIPRA